MSLLDLPLNDTDRFGMTMALRSSHMSKCYKKQVGCALVDGRTKECVCASYNRVPKCTNDCREVCARARGESCLPDYSDCPAVHAEVSTLNLLSHLINDVHQFDESLSHHLIAYITAPPCVSCFEALLYSGWIDRIVYLRTLNDLHVPDLRERVRGSGFIMQELKTY